MKHVLFLVILLSLSITSIGQYAYNDSTKNGKYVVYSANNLPEIEGNFKDHKRHGIWTWYNPDKSFRKKIRYKNGRTLWVIFYEQNKVWLKIDRYGKRRVIRACDCREY